MRDALPLFSPVTSETRLAPAEVEGEHESQALMADAPGRSDDPESASPVDGNADRAPPLDEDGATQLSHPSAVPYPKDPLP